LKLHSPFHEKELRRSVERTMRASPGLLRQRRRHRNRWLRQLSASPLFRLVFTFILARFLSSFQSADASLPAQLVLVAFWSASWTLARTNSLLTTLYHSPDLMPLLWLPTNEDTIFRCQLSKFWRGSWWGLIDLSAATLVIGLPWSPPLWAWACLFLAAIFHHALTLAVAAHLAAHFPRLPYGLPPFLIGLAFGIFYVGWEPLGPFLIRHLETHSGWLLCLLPTGWIPRIIFASTPSQDPAFLTLALPAAATLASLPLALRRLKSRACEFYRQPGDVTDLASDEQDDTDEADSPAPASSARPGLEPHQICQELFETSDWTSASGGIESMLWKWLTPQQRTLAEFASARKPRWTRGWIRGSIILALALLVAWYLKPLVSGAHIWCWIGAGALASLHLGPWFAGCTRMFDSMPVGGLQFPRWSLFPVSYGQIAVFLLKIITLRALAAIPVAALYAAAISWQTSGDPLAGLLLGLKILWLTAMIAVLAIPFFFSAKSNDTNRWGLSPLLVAGALLVAVGLFGGSALALILSSLPLLALLGMAGSASAALGFLWAYGRLLNGNHFDVLNEIRDV